MTQEQNQEIYNILEKTKLNRVVLPKNNNFILGYTITEKITFAPFTVSVCQYYTPNNPISNLLEIAIYNNTKLIGKHNITQPDSTVYKIGCAVLNKLAEQNKQNNK